MAKSNDPNIEAALSRIAAYAADHGLTANEVETIFQAGVGAAAFLIAGIGEKVSTPAPLTA